MSKDYLLWRSGPGPAVPLIFLTANKRGTMADDDRRPKIIACAHCGRKVEVGPVGRVQPKLQVDGVVKNHHGRRRSSRSLAAAQVGALQDAPLCKGRTRLHGKRQEAADHAAQD